ncbi:MAG: 30S ribosomal protein S3 [Kiritimatiellaeota bacterium]|nr:30S ribosomal protein S3 [Kiritimatiellota bacterium]
MGQKVNPIGFRVAVNKDWRSRWYADKKGYGPMLHEDLKIRDFIRRRLKDAAVPEVIIERYANRARITIHTARPGIVIGRKGEGVEKMREELSKLTGKEIYVDIREVKNPDTNAQLVAENIALQLERRVSFRRALKRSMQMAMELGVLGIKVQASGRLGSAELARREWYKEGTVPLQTLRANVQYGFAEAMTMAGKIGIKVWICNKEEQASKEDSSHATYA